MAATVRVALVVATVADPTNTARATSTVSNGAGATARVADVTAQSAASAAAVRIAEVSASSGGSSGATAQVRVAEIQAVSVQATLQMAGGVWVATTPTGVVQSVASARSAVTGTVSVTGPTLPSKATATSTVTGVVSFSAAVAVPVGVTVTDSGVKNPVPGDASGTVSLTATVNVSLTGSASVGPPGAGSLTVIPDPDNSPPRILLSLVGALGPTVTIVRIDAAGGQTAVRLANPGTLTTGGWVGYDYEAPFGSTVRYQATASRVITSDPVMLDVSTPWLIHPGIPDLSQPLHIANIGDQTRSTNQSVQYAMGRRNPIVQTDGVRRAPTFDLTVATSTVSDRDALTTLLDDTTVLLLQIGYADVADRDYMWVAVGDATQNRVTAFYGDPHRMWTLPCTVTDPPSGLLQAQRSWRDVLAEFSSWTDLLATYDTWRDVITDNRAG